VKANIFVSALPWTALASALPQHSELASKARSIKTAPILGIHLWLDRPIVTDPIIGLLDSPVHWIFDRSQPSEGKYMVAVVVSAAYEWLKFPSKDIVKRVMDELHRLLPESKEANVLHHFVYKGLDATFMTVPATESFRIGVKTEWANLKLAGDWTQTGLPATLEGAVQSGWAVARQIKTARV
jgi:monoamine oxidase